MREHSLFITENGLPHEVQEDRRKYSRLGPGQPVARALRYDHTRKAIIEGRMMIDEVKRDMNFDIKGAEFMARITKVQREKKSSWYHQAKEMKKIGCIDSNLS